MIIMITAMSVSERTDNNTLQH